MTSKMQVMGHSVKRLPRFSGHFLINWQKIQHHITPKVIGVLLSNFACKFLGWRSFTKLHQGSRDISVTSFIKIMSFSCMLCYIKHLMTSSKKLLTSAEIFYCILKVFMIGYICGKFSSCPGCPCQKLSRVGVGAYLSPSPGFISWLGA